jgi:3-oxoadipate enol-lactonase
MPFFNTTDNARLWYDDWQQEQTSTNPSPVLFFLHGFTGNRNYWGYRKGGAAWRLGHHLGNYRCVFMETRGCNDSLNAHGPFTIQQQALDVIALCDHLQIQQFTYCGHSMGGGTGFQLAATVPERLHKLVLMAPIPSGGFPTTLDPDPTPARIRRHVLQHTMYPKWTKEEYEQVFERYVVLNEGRPHHSNADFYHDRATILTEISHEYWVQSQHSMNKLRLSDAISQCNVPTLIIAGATDSLLRSNVEDSFRMKNAVLHVSSIAGHETALHDPASVSLAIHHFMEGLTLSQNQYRQRVKVALLERGHTPKPPYPKL